MIDMRMVVGLGNPGDKYINTGHNTGFKVIDSLSRALGIEVRKTKFGARFGSGEFTNKKLILLKPWEFMNRSGQAVAAALGFYKLEISNLLVVTDDLAIEPGRIRIRTKGSSGGHNGLADIIEKLGTDEFTRCRVGIGRTDDDLFQNQVDYVLDEPAENQKPLLAKAIQRARDPILYWIEYDIETTMNKYNNYIE
jgi:PTH1 family peptidyl-tRNA hydrolase